MTDPGKRGGPYYSVRTGKNPGGSALDLAAILKLFKSQFEQLSEAGYFQQAFGYWCVDSKDVPGSLGADVGGVMLLELRKENLWPILSRCLEYSEDDLFDVIEFLYDNVSKPTEGYLHSYGECGYHYHSFNGEEGRAEFRVQINRLLGSYLHPHELLQNGEVVCKADSGLENLLKADLPLTDPSRVELRVEAAIAKFRRHRSSFEDRRDALRDLAGVLEFLRPKVRAVLISQDESDLFNIANNFGIRHHNEKQKTDYDQAIWLSWMFYYYLATIHAALRMIEKNEQKPD